MLPLRRMMKGEITMITNDSIHTVYLILFTILFFVSFFQIKRLIKLNRIVFSIKSARYVDLINMKLRVLNLF